MPDDVVEYRQYRYDIVLAEPGRAYPVRDYHNMYAEAARIQKEYYARTEPIGTADLLRMIDMLEKRVKELEHKQEMNFKIEEYL